ncbi:SDR family oxidoreductase [Rhodococcus opacus]|uniref:SDR family oxidoreductase n=1 Tax=Rhodococcus opacus TaxID=37919 RepID=UPI0006BB4C9D|nr:SDR family oxidoreductase [Rhodococcus opacus]MDJ0420244.1 SDR family oxidoreductase [Rhodococcus opacus]MDV7090094.1 SDR family oxidoreductase [Rhodococcus opacus]UNN04552.1 SDR family oxidoreductase [Rhodococcus opacus]WKN52636.1 SDR family oxidoreductase [Rhodococcus opacus]
MDTDQLVAAVIDTHSPVADAVSRRLHAARWRTESGDKVHEVLATLALTSTRLDALVFAPALNHNTDVPVTELVTALVDGCDAALPTLRSDGGSVVVVVGAEMLGASTRPQVAAGYGALTSAARSLALRLATDAVTVNIIATTAGALGATAPPDQDRRPALLPHEVEADDVAAAVQFFTDPRSRYITGQVLYCCGGSTLLSSLSV